MLGTPEISEDERVIEVLRGDAEAGGEDFDRDDGAEALAARLGREGLFKRMAKFYKKHFKGRAFRILFVVALVACIAVLCANFIANNHFTVTFYQIRSEKVSDNIRIIELADLHNKEFGEGNRELVDKIAALHPDLIFYAGDMMNYKNSDYSVLFDLSDKLSQIAPVYACYGNNELDQYLFEDKEFTKKLEEHGVELLSNEKTELVVGKSKIQLVAESEGLAQYDVPTNNGKKFMESLAPTDNLRLCLTHYPELFFEKLQGKGIDVAFTGHAHGGLVRLPKIGGLYSNGEGFLPKLTAGVNEMADGTQVVVSRGLGSNGHFPRINNQPELVVVDICWY